MTTDEPNPGATGPTKRLPRVPVTDPVESLIPAWTGTTIMIRHAPDGTVTATCRGVSASGTTEWAVLEELARRLQAAGLRGSRP